MNIRRSMVFTNDACAETINWPTAHAEKLWFGHWCMHRIKKLPNGACAEAMVWPLAHAQKPWFAH